MTESVFSVNPLIYLLVPLAFLLGSIPFGIIFTKNKGVDIRSIGSRNIGATNVLRAAGKMPALLTLMADIIKGALPVVLCRIALIKTGPEQQTPEMSLLVQDVWLGIVALTAVLGHMYSVFLSFRGGKGVATGFGVLLIYSPAVAGIMFLIWIATASAFRYSALAALVSVGTMPVLLLLMKASGIKIIFGLSLALLIIYKHRSNIRNLINGTEDKIGEKNN